MNSRRIN